MAFQLVEKVRFLFVLRAAAHHKMNLRSKFINSEHVSRNLSQRRKMPAKARFLRVSISVVSIEARKTLVFRQPPFPGNGCYLLKQMCNANYTLRTSSILSLQQLRRTELKSLVFGILATLRSMHRPCAVPAAGLPQRTGQPFIPGDTTDLPDGGTADADWQKPESRPASTPSPAALAEEH